MNEKSEYELLREKNIQERNLLFASMFGEIKEFTNEFVENINKFNNATKKTSKNSRKIKKKDDSIKFSIDEPLNRRSSFRLQGKKPKYTYEDITDIVESLTTVRKISDLKKEFAFEKKEFRHKSPKKSIAYNLNIELPSNVSSSQLTPPIRAPEEITDEEIANIAKTHSEKIHSDNGMLCHQCRQQSLDTKTLCRSGVCIGLRGQFCGPCLKIRYNESVADALKNPQWYCPPCRNACNCSVCRNL